jgi:hypothetical protein
MTTLAPTLSTRYLSHIDERLRDAILVGRRCGADS